MILSDDFTDNYANATTNFNSSVSINKIGLQQGTDRTVYIEWQWGQENSTKEYKVIWYYRTDKWDMTVEAAYEYLKTLPEFKGAEDI